MAKKENLDFQIVPKAILENLPGNVWWKGRDLIYLGCNKKVLEVLGFSSEKDFIGKTDYDLWDEEIAKKLEQADLHVIATGRPINTEEIILGTDGKSLTMLTNKSPFYDRNGGVVGVVGTSTDITDRKLVEQELKETTQKLENILETIPGHIYWKDINGRYLGSNNKQARSLGFDKGSELIGKLDSELPWKNKSAEEFRENDLVVMKEGKLRVFEEQATFEGKPATVLSYKTPLEDDAGLTIGVLGVSLDITARVKAEKALFKAKKQAENANKAKTDLVANVSHDIRTPLINIGGLADIILKNAVKNSEQENVGFEIKALSQNTLNIADSLIEAAKAESGEMPVLGDCFNLNDIVDAVKSLVHFSMRRKGVQFHTSFNESISSIWVGDEKRIQRIILNLIGNAVKFTHHGYVQLKIWFEETETPENYLMKVSIRDTGIGIPEKERKLIFKRFSQLDSGNAKAKGFGIGLSIVGQFLRDLKGKVKVNSVEGMGSLFLCSIPVRLPNEEERRSVENQQVLHESADFSALKVLIVEDNSMIISIMKDLLEKEGLTMDACSTAEKGLEAYQETFYDLIFTDLNLPGKDGFWLAESIRKAEKKSLERNKDRAPSIMVGLSAHVDSEVETRCEEAGMNEAILKPLDKKRLCQVLDDYFIQSDLKESSRKEKTARSPASKDDEKIIDLEGCAADFYSDDMTAAKRMLGRLLESFPKEERNMKAAFKKKDWEKLYHLVHNFYGGAAACGVPALTKDLGVLQGKLRGENLKEEDVASFYERVLGGIKAVQQEFESL